MAKISVLLATYNGARFIEAQLESIRRQTVAPAELWVTDDGSTDGTLRLVSNFAERAHFPVRIRLNTERVGYGENFLSGTTLCEGEFIAFCDQDDDWHPEKLERCVAAMQRENAVLCAHTATLIDPASQYVGYFAQGIDRSRTFEPLTLPAWEGFLGMTMVFRREILSWIDSKWRGPDIRDAGVQLGHDLWIYFLAQSLGQVVTLSQPLVRHRRHDTNAAGPRLPAIWQRARGNAVRAGELLEGRRAAALLRSHLMTTLALERPNGPLTDRALAAAAHWRRVSDIYALRTRLYRAPTFAERRAALNRLVRLGTYRGEQASDLDNAMLAKDVTLGLCRLPFAREPVSAGPRIESRSSVSDRP
ncbi:glycosyltransferase [Phreatobacter aquaticus]|uniref:Glycosyltransferase n=1 Tax=Phreatobacter aquaticus TaxID=2570229 RepID=A0A4D7QV28_9HYPH|nr:glycosyltransferase [Phreatobacter aquaticus]QCK87822.1 glycosyltransferase [Phreatobacter aquaticus]